MKIRTGFDLAFESVQPTPMILTLNVHPSRAHDLMTPETLVFDPPVPVSSYRDGFDNICTRIVAPPGKLKVSTDFVVRDSGEPDAFAPDAWQTDVQDLPDDILIYLLGSRYCDTDKLAPIAWSLFGNTKPGWSRVQAIVDYVHGRLQFDYQRADATRTAFDGHEGRVGVCRDFAHLSVALCRCMNVPARYCTGYLGDIRIPPVPDPMDFSAWFDVYLDGRWYTFDARHNRPRVGRILMARGRDAADCALTTNFGFQQLLQFDVHTDEIE